MSNPVDGDATPITSLRQLAEHIAEGCKPWDQFGIGTEHEKFGFRLQDLKTPPYEPSDGQPGCIRDLLHGLETFGATPIQDHGHTIGLKQGDASVSLEPAGQLELSGRITATLHETQAELEEHFEQVRTVSRDLDTWLCPARVSSAGPARGHALDAQGPLRDHATVYAAGRVAGFGHDDPHLDGAGEP